MPNFQSIYNMIMDQNNQTNFSDQQYAVKRALKVQ